MYHPSSDLARLEHERHSLKELFYKEDHFVVELKVDRGYLLGEKISARHFIDCEFQNIQLFDSEFTHCNFDNFRMCFSEIRSVKFDNCTFRNVTFNENVEDALQFEGCYFEKCQMSFEISEDKNFVRKMVELLEVSQPLKLESVKDAPVLPPASTKNRFDNLDLE